jgi:uncharacterized membrane protein (UPF0127 family)
VRALRPLLVPVALLVLLAAACSGDGGDDGDGSGDGSGDGANTVTLNVVDEDGRSERLTVELARTPTERAIGLMFRDELAEDGGMLFVFAADTGSGFWMRDTTFPISVAFIREDGTIIDIQDMEPLTDDLHYPPQPYRYGLELNEGWFERHEYGVGDRVEIPAEVNTPEPVQPTGTPPATGESDD